MEPRGNRLRTSYPTDRDSDRSLPDPGWASVLLFWSVRLVDIGFPAFFSRCTQSAGVCGLSARVISDLRVARTLATLRTQTCLLLSPRVLAGIYPTFEQPGALLFSVHPNRWIN